MPWGDGPDFGPILSERREMSSSATIFSTPYFQELKAVETLPEKQFWYKAAILDPIDVAKWQPSPISHNLGTKFYQTLALSSDNSRGFPDLRETLVKRLTRYVDVAGMTVLALHSKDLIDRISLAMKLEESGSIASAIDIIYREIDSRLRKGKFPECDRALRSLSPNCLSNHVIIAILSITLAASKKLASRPQFFAMARKEFKARGLDSGSLIDGLRGWKAANEESLQTPKTTIRKHKRRSSGSIRQFKAHRTPTSKRTARKGPALSTFG